MSENIICMVHWRQFGEEHRSYKVQKIPVHLHTLFIVGNHYDIYCGEAHECDFSSLLGRVASACVEMEQLFKLMARK